MRYFIPEWDDRVDPGYNFQTNTHSVAHKAHPSKNDSYMWEIFGIENVPFDGVLVSIATLQKKPTKYQSILNTGIHNFLRLPQDFEILADCGAFSYIKEEIPPYKTTDVLKIYSDLGFNYGVSIDHLVVPMYKEQNQARMKITYDNGIEAYNEWKIKYKNDFQLIVAVQGADVADYLSMFDNFYQKGIRHFAFGSLVRTQTSFIVKLMDALIQDIKTTRKTPEFFHFFGVARCTLFPKFKEFEEMGIITSFDSSSYLRKAWLTSAHAQFNYINQFLEGYSAIRIPSKLSKEKKVLMSPEEYENHSNLVLNSLRRFDKNEIDLDEVLGEVENFNKKIEADPNLLKYYQRTLKEKPWRQCNCRICKEVGIDVAIFRGNNRNRRRGFHNVFTFYEIIKNESKWEQCQKKDVKNANKK
jgi:hypothetical protein